MSGSSLYGSTASSLGSIAYLVERSTRTMRAASAIEGTCARWLSREAAGGTVVVSMPRLSDPGPSRRSPLIQSPVRSPVAASLNRQRLVHRPFSSSRHCSAKTVPSDKGKEKAVDMSAFPPERIRNLSIIAHIDHGKSTLADRLLQMTGTLPASSNPQFLDKLKVERERGITVKAQTVSLIHRHTDGEEYLINLIDTPGHVDFSYEVSRSLGACEGGLLLVDCSQGIQAQTLSVFHVAKEANLTLLPVINKVDLPHAEPEATSLQIESSLGLDMEKHMWISAKSGEGVSEVLRRIVDDLPSPAAKNVEAGEEDKLKALVFDTHYDQFRGVVFLVRLMSGSVKKGDRVRFLQAGKRYDVLEVGIANPEDKAVDALRPGQVGYMICNMKNSEEALIGDTICWENKPVSPLPGFKPMKAMVYAGVFPTDSNDFAKLEEAIERLTLNDRSVTIGRESSVALNQGFRLGFLGTLHMDVFRQRLEDEYQSNVIITTPTVPYKIVGKDGKEVFVSNPTDFPEQDHRQKIARIEEPIVHATIVIPNEYIGEIMDLCSRYRATQLEYKVLETTGRAMLRYSFPLSEIVTDFFSELKGVSSGFASFDYEEAGYEASDMVKLSILLNGKPVDALATICHKSAAQTLGRQWTKKLREVVPRQLYELAIQAAVGRNVVARESLSAMRKDVTAGLYGGHYERKMKHLEKQKEGKKNLKRLAGSIDLPKSAFFQVLSTRASSKSYSTSARWQAEIREAPKMVDLIGPFLHGLDSIDTSAQLAPVDTPAADLAELYRLIDGPRTSSSSEQIAKLYSRLRDRNGSLTETEIRGVMLALSSSDRFSLLGQDVKSARFDTILQDYMAVSGSKQKPLPILLPCFRQQLAQQKGPERIHVTLRLEKTLRRMEKQIPAWDSPAGAQWIRTAKELMLSLGKLGFDKKLGLWTKKLSEMGVPETHHVVTATLDAATRRRHRKSRLTDVLQQADWEHPEMSAILIIRSIEGLIREQKWNTIAELYAAMHPSDDGLPRFPPSAEEPALVSLPSRTEAPQLVYTRLICQLASQGHLQEALLIMQDMTQTRWRGAHVIEYAAFFRGFARFGEVPTSTVPGRAYRLFSAEEVGREGANAPEFSPQEVADLMLRMWDPSFSSHRPGVLPELQTESVGPSPSLYTPLVSELPLPVPEPEPAPSAPRSLWTLPIMQSMFSAFLELVPTEPSKPLGRRAPSPVVVYKILAAFARLTRGDMDTVRGAWEAMHDKFKPGNREGWEGYSFDERLTKIWTPIMRTAQPASGAERGTGNKMPDARASLREQQWLQERRPEVLSLDRRAVRRPRTKQTGLAEREKWAARMKEAQARSRAYELAGREKGAWDRMRARRRSQDVFAALRAAFGKVVEEQMAHVPAARVTRAPERKRAQGNRTWVRGPRPAINAQRAVWGGRAKAL